MCPATYIETSVAHAMRQSTVVVAAIANTKPLITSRTSRRHHVTPPPTTRYICFNWLPRAAQPKPNEQMICKMQHTQRDATAKELYHGT